MPFYPLIDESQESNEDLPWLNEYLETNPKTKEGLIYLAHTVKASKKGYIITTPNFNTWVWRTSKAAIALASGLTESVQSESYPQLAVMIKLKTKDKFVIGFLDDSMAHYHWNSESSSYALSAQSSLPLVEPPNEKK